MFDANAFSVIQIKRKEIDAMGHSDPFWITDLREKIYKNLAL